MDQALKFISFKPGCPFDENLSIDLVISAFGKDGESASGQMVSASSARAVEVKGLSTVEIENT